MTPANWRSPLGLPAIVALIAFAVLATIAALERRGLTWWDALIIGVTAAAAGFAVRVLRRH
jgi:hypothetical protein